jgi:hypothetical protein
VVVGLVGSSAVMRVLRGRSDAGPSGGGWAWKAGLVRPACCGQSEGMAATVTINDVLDGHVGLDLECPDRIYLNGHVPNLQVGGQVVSFMTAHLGKLIPMPSGAVYHCAPGGALAGTADGAGCAGPSDRCRMRPHRRRLGHHLNSARIDDLSHFASFRLLGREPQPVSLNGPRFPSGPHLRPRSRFC